MAINTTNDLTPKTSNRSLGNNQLDTNRLNNASATPDKAASTQASAPRQDSVQLSQQAQTLKSLEGKAQASSGVDQGKVDAIKQQISDGSYQVSSERIAEQLLNQDDIV